MRRLADVKLTGVGRRDEAEDVDFILDVDHVRHRGAGGQRLADDHLQPTEPTLARGGQSVKFQLSVQRSDLVVRGDELDYIRAGVGPGGVQGQGRLFNFDRSDQLQFTGPATVLLPL